MKESDDIRLSKDEYDSDAQAVQESELLPIYDAMGFSGDIQPLDDISEPEEIAADFGTKKSENRNSDKKLSLKKKKIPSKRDSRIKNVCCLPCADTCCCERNGRGIFRSRKSGQKSLSGDCDL